MKCLNLLLPQHPGRRHFTVASPSAVVGSDGAADEGAPCCQRVLFNPVGPGCKVVHEQTKTAVLQQHERLF